MRLTVDADNGLGVTLAQVYPAVGKVNLHTVDGGHLLALIMLLDCLEDGIHVHLGAKFKFGLGDAVLRIGRFEFTHLLTALSKQGQEQCHAHQRVAAVVAGGIDDTAVALATDDSPGAAHLGRHVHLAHSGSRIGAAVIIGYVTQGARGGQVAHSRTWRMCQHIVGYCHQRVFLNKELAILHDDGKAVHIRVHDKAHVGLALAHKVADGGQVLGNRLRRVTEVAGRLAEEFLHLLHAQGLQQLRNRYTAHRIDGIDSDGEVCLADGINVHQVKCQHMVDVTT